MTANVTINLQADSEQETILVPTVAVGEEDDKNFVYMVRKIRGDTAMVHKRILTIGELTGEGFEVLEGLEDGEMVVTAGISKLNDSLQVRIIE